MKSTTFGKTQAMISKDTEYAQTTSTEKEDSNSELYSITSEMKAQSATEDKLVLLKGVNGAFRPGVLANLLGVSGAKKTLKDIFA
ncbi:hypothetical protein KY290_021398 [Solanum tuberosum]|uniref:Uncharacterized protein n=1 Tax=Solanum tuberosum TaxID=4113 RepID=A0ABQ7V1F2_SOLTU|nr:hypothetical protein KY289_020563 [Solanum tuberosum]KAH0693229.1 hypothetical protein KY285_020326 [Solanum tuberosum]KAH0757905.1 hypothetical protein KY290_021398 [Solanum tuberosum]